MYAKLILSNQHPVLRKFIKAGCTGYWEVHLQAVYEMLPYLAASSQSLYAKSPYIFPQSMLGLQNSNTEMFNYFKEGWMWSEATVNEQGYPQIWSLSKYWWRVLEDQRR